MMETQAPIWLSEMIRVRPTPPIHVQAIKAMKWVKTQLGSTARRDHASAAVGGKLYVLGGEDLSTAEVYDPASNSWAQGSSLTSERHCLVAIAL